MRLFETSVQCHADDVGKLTRLVQYTTRKARRAIQCCTYMNPSEGYKKAMQILKDRFESNDSISQAWISKVTNGPIIKGTHKAADQEQLRDLADDMQNCFCILQSIHMLNEIDHQSGLLKIIERLPSTLRFRWRKLVADLKKGMKIKYQGFKIY